MGKRSSAGTNEDRAGRAGYEPMSQKGDNEDRAGRAGYEPHKSGGALSTWAGAKSKGAGDKAPLGPMVEKVQAASKVASDLGRAARKSGDASDHKAAAGAHDKAASGFRALAGTLGKRAEGAETPEGAERMRASAKQATANAGVHERARDEHGRFASK